MANAESNICVDIGIRAGIMITCGGKQGCRESCQESQKYSAPGDLELCVEKCAVATDEGLDEEFSKNIQICAEGTSIFNESSIRACRNCCGGAFGVGSDRYFLCATSCGQYDCDYWKQ